MNVREVLVYVRECYGTSPDHPWQKEPDHMALRHEGNGKWYGLIMKVERTRLGLSGAGDAEILNLKCEPELINLIRSQQGILGAYHMNKKHWITILLDGSVPSDEIRRLIDLSYELTR